MSEQATITIDERSGRYRVKAEYPGGKFAVIGIFGDPAQAVAYATGVILNQEEES